VLEVLGQQAGWTAAMAGWIECFRATILTRCAQEAGSKIGTISNQTIPIDPEQIHAACRGNTDTPVILKLL